MSKGHDGESTELSVELMRTWLREEVANVTKECELRIKDATDFVTAYACGALSKKDANKRLNRYDERWHGALGGVFATSYENSDKQIESDIDKGHGERERRRRRHAAGGKVARGPIANRSNLQLGTGQAHSGRCFLGH